MVGKDGYCPTGHLVGREVQPAEPVFAPAPAPASPQPTAAAFGPPPPLPIRRVPRRGSRAILIVAILALIAVGAVTVIAFGPHRSAAASNLKLVFTPGEKHTYSFEMSVRGTGGNLTGGFNVDVGVDARFTRRTLSVGPDKRATVRYTMDDVHLTGGGNRVAAPPGTGGSITIRMTPDGRVTPVDGVDAFGLQDVNPFASFLSPENLGPLLPNRRVDPGETWVAKTKETDPDTGIAVSLRTVNTLLERRTIGGNDAAVIRSETELPLDVTLDHDALVRGAGPGEAADVAKDARIGLVGSLKMTLTQTIFTANGLVQTVLGDGTLKGTMTLDGIPGQKVTLSLVFNLNFQITMTRTSGGAAA